MTTGLRNTHAASGRQLIKGSIALLISLSCFGLLIILLSPVAPHGEGLQRRQSDVIAIRPAKVKPPVLRSA